MRNFRNWYKGLKRQEKVMLIFIILLIIAIMTRWAYIRSEVAESFRWRFTPRSIESTLPVNDSLKNP